MNGSGAAAALREARRQVQSLFGEGGSDGPVVRSWREARRDWDDAVARQAELSEFDPLRSEAARLARLLEELASRIDAI